MAEFDYSARHTVAVRDHYNFTLALLFWTPGSEKMDVRLNVNGRQAPYEWTLASKYLKSRDHLL